jgi:hypothetical protein
MDHEEVVVAMSTSSVHCTSVDSIHSIHSFSGDLKLLQQRETHTTLPLPLRQPAPTHHDKHNSQKD